MPNTVEPEVVDKSKQPEVVDKPKPLEPAPSPNQQKYPQSPRKEATKPNRPKKMIIPASKRSPKSSFMQLSQ